MTLRDFCWMVVGVYLSLMGCLLGFLLQTVGFPEVAIAVVVITFCFLVARESILHCEELSKALQDSGKSLRASFRKSMGRPRAVLRRKPPRNRSPEFPRASVPSPSHPLHPTAEGIDGDGAGASSVSEPEQTFPPDNLQLAEGHPSIPPSGVLGMASRTDPDFEIRVDGSQRDAVLHFPSASLHQGSERNPHKAADESLHLYEP